MTVVAQERVARPAGSDPPEAVLDEREYYLTGQWHVEHVLGLLRRVFDPPFAPARVLDIGCGRGRATLALARRAACVTAVEPHGPWLEEARRRAGSIGLSNIHWVQAGPELASVQGPFDLVHACLAPERADAPLRLDLHRIVQRLAPHGLAALYLPLHDGPAQGPDTALSSLQRAGVRRCHVELATGPGGGTGAMLYFASGDPSR